MSPVAPEGVGPSEHRASMRAVMPPVGATVWLLLDQGTRFAVLLRSTGESVGAGRCRWVEDRWLVDGGHVVCAVERTIFELSERGFGEVARFREAGGPNLHRQAIRIPSEPELGVAARPFPDADATLTLTHAGRIRFGGETMRGLALSAEIGGERRVQWMVEGFGEVWIGAPDAPPFRWAIGGWCDDGRTLGAGLAEALRQQPLPGLPPVGAGARAGEDPFG